jgi:hypothetical protein
MAARAFHAFHVCLDASVHPERQGQLQGGLAVYGPAATSQAHLQHHSAVGALWSFPTAGSAPLIIPADRSLLQVCTPHAGCCCPLSRAAMLQTRSAAVWLLLLQLLHRSRGAQRQRCGVEFARLAHQGWCSCTVALKRRCSCMVPCKLATLQGVLINTAWLRSAMLRGAPAGCAKCICIGGGTMRVQTFVLGSGEHHTCPLMLSRHDACI